MALLDNAPTNLLGQDLTSVIWGNQPAPVTQDFGVPGAAASYFPGETDYGMPADNYHSGIDIGVPAGTPLYSPVAGTVVCDGTGNGPGVNGQGCAAYDSYFSGPTQGRYEIQFGNGESVILGHVEQGLLPAGTQVTRGQEVAISGGAGSGDHVHVEERIPDALGGMSTTSGYEIVSPLDVIGGSPVTLSQSGGTVVGQTAGPSAIASLLPQVGPFMHRVGWAVLGLLGLGLGLIFLFKDDAKRVAKAAVVA